MSGIEKLNLECLSSPFDLRLKLLCIAQSLDDLTKIYADAGEENSIEKVNEIFFDAIEANKISIRTTRDLIIFLESVRVYLEPDGFGVNFIDNCKVADERKIYSHANNQSSSIAILNYLSGALGLSSDDGLKVVKTLFHFKAGKRFFEFLTIWGVLLGSFILGFRVSHEVALSLAPSLPEAVVALLLLAIIIFVPLVSLIIYAKIFKTFDKKSDDMVKEMLRNHFRNRKK